MPVYSIYLFYIYIPILQHFCCVMSVSWYTDLVSLVLNQDCVVKRTIFCMMPVSHLHKEIKVRDCRKKADTNVILESGVLSWETGFCHYFHS